MKQWPLTKLKIFYHLARYIGNTCLFHIMILSGSLFATKLWGSLWFTGRILFDLLFRG